MTRFDWCDFWLLRVDDLFLASGVSDFDGIVNAFTVGNYYRVTNGVRDDAVEFLGGDEIFGTMFFGIGGLDSFEFFWGSLLN